MSTVNTPATSATKIFLNLSIQDMARSQAFFKSLGYSFNPQFTNDQGACLVISDTIHVMLLVKSFFQTFTPKTIIDAHKSIEALICLSCNSRAEVDALVSKALAAGGKAVKQMPDPEFMYSRGFEDLDGHQWELVYMDMSAVPAQP